MGYNAVFMGIFLPHCEISLPLIAPKSNFVDTSGKPTLSCSRFTIRISNLIERNLKIDT